MSQRALVNHYFGSENCACLHWAQTVTVRSQDLRYKLKVHATTCIGLAIHHIYLAGSRAQHWCYIFLNSITPREGNPAGTRRNDNVIMTSMRRRDVVLTSQWRCFWVVCWNRCMSGVWCYYFVGLLKFISGFLKSQPLGIMSHQYISGIVTGCSELHWYFHSCIILKKQTKNTHNIFIERWIADCS